MQLGPYFTASTGLLLKTYRSASFYELEQLRNNFHRYLQHAEAIKFVHSSSHVSSVHSVSSSDVRYISNSLQRNRYSRIRTRHVIRISMYSCLVLFIGASLILRGKYRGSCAPLKTTFNPFFIAFFHNTWRHEYIPFCISLNVSKSVNLWRKVWRMIAVLR